MTGLPQTVIGGRTFHWGERTFVMGIVNVTPDSFSGDGLGFDVDAAVFQAKKMTLDGADIIDVGGESTRPGASSVSVEEELKRVIPVIERLCRQVDIPVSIDTYKYEVAEAAVKAGATWVNDIWGLKKDSRLAELAAHHNIGLILTANERGEGVQDIVSAVKADLTSAIAKATAAGVEPANIILDPGFGFGKTLEQNLELLRRMNDLKCLGHPILAGISRKSMIGGVLGLPAEDRLEGTAATVAIAIAHGADMVRVHDVKFMARVAKMADALVTAYRPPQLEDKLELTSAASVFLGLGSNLGDRTAHLEAAIELLSQRLAIVRKSGVYETSPLGVPDQPPFLNMVIEVQTHIVPVDLLRLVKGIEQKLGRGTAGSTEPRTIDIDILLYGDQKVASPELTIPHPRLAKRGFVLRPLADLAPRLIPPGGRRNISELLTSAGDKGVQLYEPENNDV